jgi:SPX domain protein involved in polyphosphate accumulation
MKFGRRISRIAADHPNLAPYYIDYKGLKRLLKTAAHPAADADDVADAQERFALQLESEITKVPAQITDSLTRAILLKSAQHCREQSSHRHA